MKVPAYFDGAKFATKYGLSRTDFRIDGNGELVCPTVQSPDLADCVYDPAAVEAEEAAEKTRAEKLHTLAEWLRVEPQDLREKFLDILAKLELAETAIKDLRARVKALEEA